MSAESLRARLEAATPGEWMAPSIEVKHLNPAVVYGPAEDWPGHITQVCNVEGGATARKMSNARLIAHAPTDLRLALDVIEAAKSVSRLAEQCELASDLDDYRDIKDAFDGSVEKLDNALDAFEAAP